MSVEIQLNSIHKDYEALNAICIAGLKASLNPRSRLFDLQLMNKIWKNTFEFYSTEDLTSTAICLIGISRGNINAAQINLDVNETLGAMNALSKTRDYAGGFGLVLWANAVNSGKDLTELQQICDVNIGPVANFVARLTTMEVAWLVSGLAHEYKRSGESSTRTMLMESAQELMNIRFQPSTQTVVHARKSGSLFHDMRRWIANFADQVYTIQALAFASVLLHDERAKNIAECIANRMIGFQGSKGQWWWHYDAKRGGSPQPYSVYSVHQHGMAPMALRALEKSTGKSYQQSIEMSLGWLKNNELNCKIVDHDQPTIWRSIEYRQSRLRELYRKFRSLTGLAGDESQFLPPALQLNYETRPYEWAWCIYAAAIDSKVDSPPHIA